MVNKVYIFNNQESNNSEATKHIALAAMKQTAFVETVKFIFDGCRGFNPEIPESTIDDAFDYVINCEKATLYTQELTKEERDKMLMHIEANRKVRKDWFKSYWLKVKE